MYGGSLFLNIAMVGVKPGVVRGRVWKTQQFLIIQLQISPGIDNFADSDEETETGSHLSPNLRHGHFPPSPPFFLTQLHWEGMGKVGTCLSLKMLQSVLCIAKRSVDELFSVCRLLGASPPDPPLNYIPRPS